MPILAILFIVVPHRVDQRPPQPVGLEWHNYHKGGTVQAHEVKEVGPQSPRGLVMGRECVNYG